MASKMPTALNSENAKQFLDSFDTVFTDADGVLWNSNDPITNSIEVLSALMKVGKKVFLITNNSTKSREELLIKSQKMGLLNFTVDNILCTAHAAATFLKEKNFNKTVYVVGQSGISKELDNVGIKHFGVGPDMLDTSSVFERELNIQSDVGAVIVGFDSNLSYNKICKACTYLNDPNCLFIATNTDAVFPQPNKNLVFAGSGCMVSAIATPAQREPSIMGKPSTYLYESTAKLYPTMSPERTLMIGDRADTDILFGAACGMKTLVVLSGITTEQDINKWANSTNPSDKKLIADYVLPKLGDLLPYI